jgi:glycerate 2-kinase
MRVVVAPDKFKGFSLTAAEVVDAVASGLLAVAPDTDVVRVPIAPEPSAT